MQQTRFETIRGLLGAVFAGALGGALVGVAEAALVTFTSAANDEYWLVLFGVCAYGAFGAALGLGGAIAWALVRRGRAGALGLTQAGAIAAVVPLAFVIARYHVNQRLFDESLSFASSLGAMTYGAMLVGAVLAALVVALFARMSMRRLGVAGPGLAVAALALVAWGIGVATDHSGAPPITRRTSAAAAGKPNVILVIVDTLRSDAAEWAAQQGGGFARLKRDGVTFSQAYAQASWTRPSVATILTGEYPSVHGADSKMAILSNDADTLAEVFKRQGYWTAAFTTNINVTPIFNFQQGFDEFHYLEPSFYFGATDSATKLAIYKGLRAAREKLSSAIYVENFYQDAKTVDEAVEEWLGSKPPEPFFLLVHYMDPHDPFFEIPYNGKGVARVRTPNPPGTQARALHDLYATNVRYHDEYLQKLLDRLQARGSYDEAIIALVADHGEEFYEHGGWWHGTTLYEEQLHVPFIIKRGREPEAGQTRTDLARMLDVASTLTGAAGVQPGPTFQGVDLFRERVSEPLYAEEDLEGNRLTSLRRDDWKLIVANPGNPRGLAPHELYNLRDDPNEQKNLAAQESGRVAEMAAEMDAMRARIARGRGARVATAGTDAADSGS